MARFHMSCHATIGVAGRNDGSTPQGGGIPIAGQPEDDPELYDVVAAGVVALPPGTRYVLIHAITGSLYALSGLAGDDPITAPHGMLIREGDHAPLGITPGHTHLHVIAGDPANDAAIT